MTRQSQNWTWARIIGEMGSDSYAVARSRRAACFVLSLPLDADDQQIEAALTEVQRPRAGGCARDQRTTQFCAEVVDRDERIARMRENALGTAAVLKDISDENDYLRAEVQRRIDHGSALYNAVLRALTPHFPPGDRGLEWDVLPGTIGALARERDELRTTLDAEREKRRTTDAVLAQLATWCLTFGASLCPRGGDADTFGDGVRAMKEQVAGILRAAVRDA